MKYKTIVADPPWQYKNRKTGRDMKHGAEAKYKTLSLREICSLPIQDIADKNCVLFLWATTPLLPEAFHVMQEWGFKYKTAIYWRKIMLMGMGFWFRGQVELCLLGIRGKVKAFRAQKCNFIQCKAGKHSQKPKEFFDLIEPYTPKPRIELFAREKRKGWNAWGNEVESDTSINFSP